MPERERVRQREGDMVRRRKRDIGGGRVLERERNCYEEQGEGAVENALEMMAAESRQK